MVIKNAIVYAGSSVIARAFPFLLLPFVTRIVSADDVGIASILILYWGVANAFVGGNGHAYLSRIYYHVDDTTITKTITNILVANAILALGTLAILLILSGLFPDLFIPFGKLLWFMPLGALMQAGVTLATTLARFEQRPFVFMIYEIGFAVLTTLVTIVYIIYIRADWGYQYWSLAAGVGVIFGVSMLTQRRFQPSLIAWDEVRTIVKFCLPQIFHVISGTVLAIGDRYIIRDQISNEMVGIYAATFMLCSTYNVLIDAYVRAYSPSQFIAIKDEGINTKTGNLLLLRSASALLVLAFLMAGIIWVVFDYFFPENYIDGRILVLYFIGGFLFFGIYKLIYPFILHLNKQNSLVLALVLIMVVSLTLNFIYLKSWGIVFAGMVTTGSYFALAVFSIIVLSISRGKHE